MLKLHLALDAGSPLQSPAENSQGSSRRQQSAIVSSIAWKAFSYPAILRGDTGLRQVLPGGGHGLLDAEMGFLKVTKMQRHCPVLLSSCPPGTLGPTATGGSYRRRML